MSVNPTDANGDGAAAATAPEAAAVGAVMGEAAAFGAPLAVAPGEADVESGADAAGVADASDDAVVVLLL